MISVSSFLHGSKEKEVKISQMLQTLKFRLCVQFINREHLYKKKKDLIPATAFKIWKVKKTEYRVYRRNQKILIQIQ